MKGRAALIAAALVLSACGGDDGGDDETAGNRPATPTEADGGGNPPATPTEAPAPEPPAPEVAAPDMVACLEEEHGIPAEMVGAKRAVTGGEGFRRPETVEVVNRQPPGTPPGPERSPLLIEIWPSSDLARAAVLTSSALPNLPDEAEPVRRVGATVTVAVPDPDSGEDELRAIRDCVHASSS
jgi:hypothetical protein